MKKKPLKYIPVKGRFARKGDVDVEIVLDVVIIISGDSDYLDDYKTEILKEFKRLN